MEKKQDIQLWLDWAVELQALAQAGLAYTKDAFDRERFERIRAISAEILSHQSEIPFEKAVELFCNESGYQTPKLETRAAVFSEERILLVQEKDGRWSLPGGWVDVNKSIRENAEKEVWEEAGLRVKAKRLIALHDRNRHNKPVFAYGICKVFVLCEALDGAFRENLETVASGYFPLEHLPELSEDRNTKEQIALCFSAYHDENWSVVFD